ncbi:MAG: PLP-dependent aminotransferase family protein [Acidobacteriota bacterium]
MSEIATPGPRRPPRASQGSEPLYRRVAEHVSRMIEDGTLAEGARLPSLRKLHRQLSVSVTTVMEAYRLLEDRGLIEARPQSGHYVRPRPPSLQEPNATRTGEAASSPESGELIEQVVREAGRPGLVGPFGVALPRAELLPVARLNRFLGRAVRRDPEASQEFDDLPGRLDLRREIARRALEGGCVLSPDDLVITTGASEAISLSLRAVTHPGDTVAIETPTYQGFLQVLEGLHLKALEISTSPKTGISISSLEEKIDTGNVAAVLSVPTLGNPLGYVMPEGDRRRLAEMLSRYDVPLIEDDTYGDALAPDERPPSIKSFDEEGRVLLLSSFSKMLAPGYRIGWIAPGRHLKDVLRMKFSSSLATASPTQMAMAEYLAHGGYDKHLRSLRREFTDLVSRMARAIARSFPPGTRVTRPPAGYVLWVELPERTDSFDLYRAAIAEGISLLPGPLFSAAQRYRNFVRISCAVPWSPQIEASIERLGELAGQLQAKS